MTTRRVVAALGGNALLRRGQPLEAEVQRENLTHAVRALAELAATSELVVTHGNGPQIGLLALQAAAYTDVHPYPLDVLGAESEGMIGYLLEQGLRNELPGREIVTLLTQVVVAGDDPAFAHPTKPIGPVYTEEQALQVVRERGWSVAADGPHFRRVVASPEPLEIVELEAIRLLVESNALVVCAGGGGIPVVLDERKALRGVEAVIDKDRSAALLAQQLEADLLLMLTDVSAVELDWGTPAARPLRQATPDQLRALAFPAGSMGPKVEAACRFADRAGREAVIGSLFELDAISRGKAGTRITPRQATAAVTLASSATISR